MAGRQVSAVATPQRVSCPQDEPSTDLLAVFIEHWKGVTHYYLEATGKRRRRRRRSSNAAWPKDGLRKKE